MGFLLKIVELYLSTLNHKTNKHKKIAFKMDVHVETYFLRFILKFHIHLEE